MQTDPLNPERSALEAALASLTPAASGVDRDRLMFLAGQAAAAPRQGRAATQWLWPTATAASVLLAVTMGALWRQAERRAGQDAVQLAAPAPSVDAPAPAGALAAHPGMTDYLRLRRAVLERGVDALPSADSSSTGEPTQPPLRASDLDKWLLETRS